jgi:3-isopropylmalate/(R)-2-methylmalate dehydratase large subunit
MGMTIAEKILARHAGRERVSPGEYVWAKVDETNLMPPVAGAEFTKIFDELGVTEVFDPDRVYATIDHSSPPADIANAGAAAELRRIVKRYGIKNFFDIGRQGIQHHVFPENGYVRPGELVLMADSHSTTYGAFNVASTASNIDAVFVAITGMCWFRVPESIRFSLLGELPKGVLGKDVVLEIARRYGTDVALYKSIEFTGPGAREMALAHRWSIANMGVELGAKFALFEADEAVNEFLRDKTSIPYEPVSADLDARYEAEYSLNLSNLEPIVALPGDPGNGVPVSQVPDGIRVDQVFIGSCNEGRVENFEIAAEILKGREVHPDVRLIASPGSQEVWKECSRKGIWDTFTEAGALVAHSTCGPCMGSHLGVLTAKEVCVSTGPRNFRGRMGHPDSEVYLANSATAAAAAVAGTVVDPRGFLE